MKLTPRTLPRYLPLCLLACVSPSSATAQNATLRYISGSSFTPVPPAPLQVMMMIHFYALSWVCAPKAQAPRCPSGFRRHFSDYLKPIKEYLSNSQNTSPFARCALSLPSAAHAHVRCVPVNVGQRGTPFSARASLLVH